jgi:predicted DNA-binding protein
MKRTQIYLDEAQDRELAQMARASGVTKSELIRRAIERLLHPAEDDARRLQRFQRAVDAAAGRAADLPEGRVYVETLRAADAERQRELEERRRR